MKKSNKYKKLIKMIKGLVTNLRMPFSFSKKRNNVFSNRVLLIIYVLMQKEEKSYREIIDFVELLRDEIKLSRLPHFTTINKFALRIKPAWFYRLIEEIVSRVSIENSICAIDGTGFSLNSRSSYFETIAGERREFLQFNSCCENKFHLITACRIRRKRRNENVDAPYLMKTASKQLDINYFLMDKLYDSEKNHEIAEKCGAQMIAPLRKKTDQYHRIKGVHRKNLFKYFPREIYNKRASIVENEHSIIKNKYGEVIYAKRFRTQKIELLGKVIIYDLEKILFFSFVESLTFYSTFFLHLFVL
jgi:hypothetical protein